MLPTYHIYYSIAILAIPMHDPSLEVKQKRSAAHKKNDDVQDVAEKSGAANEEVDSNNDASRLNK